MIFTTTYSRSAVTFQTGFRRNLFLPFVAFASLVAPHLVRTCNMSMQVEAAYSSPKVAKARKDHLVYGMHDALFGHIEKMQGTKPFGSFLDAGTGVHSLRWIATLANDDVDNPRLKNSISTTMTDFTAVTADESMRRNVQREVDQLGMTHLGNVVIGNWFPPDGDDSQSLASIDKDEDGNLKKYDTILADYLIGAMDGFSPYTQDQMIEKLAKRLKPGGRLYIVGLQPIPDSYGAPDSPQNIICEVRKARDACILLAGDRCYREYPLDWVKRQVSLTKSSPDASLKLLNSRKFPILYRHNTIVKQINVGRRKLSRFPTKALADQMKVVLDDLERRSFDATEKVNRRIELGFDYVVTVERTMPEESTCAA